MHNSLKKYIYIYILQQLSDRLDDKFVNLNMFRNRQHEQNRLRDIFRLQDGELLQRSCVEAGSFENLRVSQTRADALNIVMICDDVMRFCMEFIRL